MKQVFKFVVSAVAVAALGACGGGGGGDPSPAPAKYSQAAVQTTASVGILATIATGRSGRDLMVFLGSLFESFALDSGGSRTVAGLFCSTGTATQTFAKDAVRTGLAAGDQVTVTFSQCALDQSGYFVDGAVILTATNSVDTYDPNAYSVAFRADMRALTLTLGDAVRKHDGVLDIQSSLAQAGPYSNSFGVPQGQTYTGVETALSTNLSLSYRYGPGTTYAGTDGTSPNVATRKLDGAVTGSSGTPIPLLISTPAALVGTTSTGRFVASSGVIDTTSLLENMATTTTISGTAASISGDTDQDGSQDLVFTTTWAALTN